MVEAFNLRDMFGGEFLCKMCVLMLEELSSFR